MPLSSAFFDPRCPIRLALTSRRSLETGKGDKMVIDKFGIFMDNIF